MAQHDGERPHLSAWTLFWRDMRDERTDLLKIVIYAICAAVLSLAVPICAQALVNTVAAGVFVQPLVVLSILVCVGMLFAGGMRIAQFRIVELLQQRVFAKTAIRAARHLLVVRYQTLTEEYGPELVNRFFDTLTIQKSLAKLLMDGPAAMLQIFAGLILVATYSPLFVAFDVFFIIGMVIIVLLGRGGLATSIAESDEKYRVAHWLEEISRCHVGLRLGDRGNYVMQRTDTALVDYVETRRSHFAILLRQTIAGVIVQAFGLTGVLAIGGWLVVNRQLTLGALVAAELIILIIMSALDKLVAQIGPFFDLLTAHVKIDHVLALPTERQGGSTVIEAVDDAFSCERISFGYRDDMRLLLRDFTMRIPIGGKIGLVGVSGAGKTTIAHLLGGYLTPKTGTVKMRGIDARSLDLTTVRKSVRVVGEAHEILEATIEENIVLGRGDVSHTDLHAILDMLELREFIDDLPNGLQTRLSSEGRILSLGQRQRILAARALYGAPDLVVLDEAFSGVDQGTKARILDVLMAPGNGLTVLAISHDPAVVLRTETTHVLGNGHIVESGRPQELARTSDGAFIRLFPYMQVIVGGSAS